MSFLAMIVKNLLRQRVRTGLTVLGISIGITTVVALGVITGGMKATMADIMHAGGADFMVAQEGSSDLTFSIIDEQQWAAIEAREDVLWAHGTLMHVAPVGNNPYFVLAGVRPEDLAESPPELLAGMLLEPSAPDQVLLGERAAADLGLSVGGQVEIGGERLVVTGIYRTGMVWQDSGAYAPLDVVQTMAGKPGLVTAVYVKAQPGASVESVAAGIEQDVPNVAAIASLSDYGEVDQGAQIIDALNLAISVLAVGIGAIGVMNTMVMSVFERTREIGILRAVGWGGRRILRMVIGESLLLCVLAAGVGMLLGLLAVRAVMLIDTIQAFLEPSYDPAVFLRALGVAVVVALAGAAYPAFRAVRLTPMEALRHE